MYALFDDELFKRRLISEKIINSTKQGRYMKSITLVPRSTLL